MANLGFLKDFRKTLEKQSLSTGIKKPLGWWSTGNLALNKALSGSFQRGIPVGRITLFAGPSGSGKSFISSNIMREAQRNGAHILVLDSENALDIEYLVKIGVDISEERLTYVAVDTIEDVNSACSEFFSMYEKEYVEGNKNVDIETLPKVLIVLDSIAMLSTETEAENYDKSGTVKADQGIRSKRTKSMLRMILKKISRLPIAMVATDHVYPQDIMLGDGPWAITNSTKFAASIIGIITKLKLKEDAEVVGVRMRFETYKSRFAKIGTKVELEVPYNAGMAKTTGLIDLLEEKGLLKKDGNSKAIDIDGEYVKFNPKKLDDELITKLLSHSQLVKEETMVEEKMKEISAIFEIEELEEETENA